MSVQSKKIDVEKSRIAHPTTSAKKKTPNNIDVMNLLNSKRKKNSRDK